MAPCGFSGHLNQPSHGSVRDIHIQTHLLIGGRGYDKFQLALRSVSNHKIPGAIRADIVRDYVRIADNADRCSRNKTAILAVAYFAEQRRPFSTGRKDKIMRVVARSDADNQVAAPRPSRRDGPGNIGADGYAVNGIPALRVAGCRKSAAAKRDVYIGDAFSASLREDVAAQGAQRFACLQRKGRPDILYNLNGTRLGALVMDELHRPGALLHIHTLESALGIRGVGIPVQIHAGQYHDLNAAKRRAATIRNHPFQEVQHASGHPQRFTDAQRRKRVIVVGIGIIRFAPPHNRAQILALAEPQSI
ncbi:MAG: hypothetical protein BWX80_03533 [Candidatus Hydrogenedentes bacterium ADurb.Bin101]|nr:MAG: hypothetical protein BWX80_03533 [Candidatus Hydrogenedentes bacterium ADurb.Bin101]